MIKTQIELEEILTALLKYPENEWVEFKKATNNFDINKLGQYFSAISNESNLNNKQYGWIVFGVDDKTHEITGTNYCESDDFNNVKKQITDNTTDNVGFIAIYSFYFGEKRIIMFQVPATAGIPMNWKGFSHGRSGESLVPLTPNKIEQIRATANSDWSRKIIEEATVDNLDEDAILFARKQFKTKNYGKKIANEIDDMSDIEFLNKAKVTLNGQITNATMLLLGKNECDYLIEDYNPKMTWKLYDEINVIDYEHFGIPYILEVDKLKSKIRNLRYRYMIDDSTLFPNEIYQYDNYILRELLNNAIVHQDYRLKGIINVIEFKDKIIVSNEGTFIPKRVENVLEQGYSSPYYRNQFLASAMVSLNMIDTVGSGIRRIYNIQKEKFFPLPDYDLQQNSRVAVVLYGKIIDENYTRLLSEKTNLPIEEVRLLDRLQKKLAISKEESDYLKKAYLIEGRYPNVYITAAIAKLTEEKEKYIFNVGLENDYYKKIILRYIDEYGKATRKEVLNLLREKLPASLNETNKLSRVKYLLRLLRKEGKIYYDNSPGYSCWKRNVRE